MRPYWKRFGAVAILLAGSVSGLAGCGESTEIPLAKVDPVTLPPEGPKAPVRPGLQVSPDILPGVR